MPMLRTTQILLRSRVDGGRGISLLLTLILKVVIRMRLMASAIIPDRVGIDDMDESCMTSPYSRRALVVMLMF